MRNGIAKEVAERFTETEVEVEQEEDIEVFVYNEEVVFKVRCNNVLAVERCIHCYLDNLPCDQDQVS